MRKTILADIVTVFVLFILFIAEVRADLIDPPLPVSSDLPAYVIAAAVAFPVLIAVLLIHGIRKKKIK
ncbi:MAG: hypothetical protein K6A40_02200 [Solobacterium sp.]|nr:hypothetical protein [Solobacterium sp.]